MIVAVLADAHAQGRQGAPPPPVPAPPAPAAQREQEPVNAPVAAVNVRINVAVIEDGAPQTPLQNVTLTTVDRLSASLRSQSDMGPAGPLMLAVDATPQISGLPPGKIRLSLTIEYLPKPNADQPRGGRTQVKLAAIVDDGKTVVASNWLDPRFVTHLADLSSVLTLDSTRLSNASTHDSLPSKRKCPRSFCGSSASR
jgi:hypothetical protein